MVTRWLIVLALLAPTRARAEAVVHVPPPETAAGQPLQLAAVVDPRSLERALIVRWRAAGETTFTATSFSRSSTGEYLAVIPPEAVAPPAIEYYLVGVGRDGAEVPHFASARWPHRVRVELSPAQRWVAAEDARLAGRRDVVGAWMMWQGFHGYRTEAGVEHDDHYLRGEIELTHRLLTGIYSFTLGYGAVQGVTPAPDMPDAGDRGVRYGYGGFRLRLHPSAWLDARAVLGFSDRRGFVVGTGGSLLLGKSWSSNVSLGAEYIQDLSGRLWVRLQWDTVPGVLMGAQVTKDNFPDAAIADGATFALDASLPVAGGLTLSARISAGARGRRAASFGGGLGVSWEL